MVILSIPKTLKEIAKLPLLERADSYKVRELWLDHHKSRKDCVPGVLDKHEFHKFSVNATSFPDFFLPLRPPNGGRLDYRGLFLQAQPAPVPNDLRFMVCDLGDFQKKGENANPLMVVSLYADFIQAKELALLRGQVVGHLDRESAERIVKFLRMTYGERSPLFQYLKTFRQSNFNLQDYIEAVARSDV